MNAIQSSLDLNGHRDTFKRLYYHFYSNSSVSRAERLMSDLSKLILVKLSAEKLNQDQIILRFTSGEGTANSLLGPLLTEAFPHMDPSDTLFQVDDRSLRVGLQELENISLHSMPAHIIGDAFEALLGPKIRGDKGQFFTPRTLVRTMVKIVDPQPGDKIVDPACGTGGFLVEAAKHCISRGADPKAQRVIGVDKDKDMWLLSTALLEAVADGSSEVFQMNSLELLLRDDAASRAACGADVVLTNPPFGSKIGITDTEILRKYDFGHQWITSPEGGWIKTDRLVSSQDPQVLFLELAVRLLKPGGKLGIVLPEGMFGNRTTAFIWQWLRERGQLLAMIDCPRTTFQPYTDTKTNVLFFELNRHGDSDRHHETWISVALHCGHDKRGKVTLSSGAPHPDDFEDIASCFESRHDRTDVWSKVDLSSYDYLVPRYFDGTTDGELSQLAARTNGRVLRLRDLVAKGFLSVRKGHEVGSEAYGSGETPFVRTSDISNWEISNDPTNSVSEDIYQRYQNQQNLEPGDILLVVDGRYRIGRTAILSEFNYKCIVQSHFRILKVSPSSPFTAYEFLYILNLPVVQRQLRNLTFVQSTLGSLGHRLGELQLPLPTENAEWRAKVELFEGAIKQRGRLLQDLHGFESFDFEL